LETLAICLIGPSGALNSIGKRLFTWTGRGVIFSTTILTAKGIDIGGEHTSFQGAVTKTGKKTLNWQTLRRIGGIVEGPSPTYTFKRVKQAKQPKRPQQDK
jgi:hypothetical protein